jgi:CHAT domain-containing protein
VIHFPFKPDWRTFVLGVAMVALACNGEKPYPEHPRMTLPRLTGLEGWRECRSSDGEGVAKSNCGPATIPDDLVSIGRSECHLAMNTEIQTARLLAFVPDCTDAAVEKLKWFAATHKSAAALSRLAAAYFVRAERKDQPSDLVSALNAADLAVALPSGTPEALFNRALALEALGFPDEAIADWDAVRQQGEPGWAAEAQKHADRLRQQRTLSAAIQWPLNVQRLPEVARAGDEKGVEALVTPYRAVAQRYVEEEVLPAWATAARAGNDAKAAEHLQLARAIASALAKLTSDTYLLDAVERVRAAQRSKSLQDAHLRFQKARSEESAFNFPRAAELYAKAEEDFSNTGSPMRFGAMLGRLPALTLGKKFDRSLRLLRSLQADALQYPHVIARTHAGLGYLYTVEGRNADAIAEYGRAETIYTQLRDSEGLANVHSRKTGLFRIIGQEDLTWRELFGAMRQVQSVSDAPSRHAFLGESASSAAALGYPDVALRYQDSAVRLFRNELARNADAVETRLQQMRRNLGIALRNRAAIRVQLNEVDGARTDLDEAVRLIDRTDDVKQDAIISGLRARFAEVEALLTAPQNRKGAIALLSRALVYAKTTHFYTLIASLLTQRAALYRLEGDRQAAVRDLQGAIQALHTEERLMLSVKTDPPDPIWSPYFSRYQEAYRQLVGLLIENGQELEAFAYAERARAYEPLHRLLQRDGVPAAFRNAIRGGEPLGLDATQRMLPPGTFLLHYTVLEDETFVWLIWHEGSQRLTLPVGNAKIAEWAAALQQLADTRSHEGWDTALTTPYQTLFAGAIGRIATLHRTGETAKIVIVPHRAMHGLPFAALRNGDRYLVRDFRVSVAASATLYAFSLEQDRQLSQHKAESMLIVADPAFDRSLDVAANLDRLQNARIEAERIASVYKPAMDVPPPLMDADATVPAFLNRAGHSTIIHIASHSVANPNVPSRSFLLLAPTENDSGVLDAERLIGQLRLDRTRLVVLSACSTAGGTHIGPEGLAPLVRPIVAAGVPGIVGALWNVDDNPAPVEVLVRFHRNYRDGADADEALRRAQLEMIEDDDLARKSPRAWAAFQMIGHASSPFAQIRK